MELATSIDRYLCPTAAFLDKAGCDFFRTSQAEYEELQDSNNSTFLWSLSIHNPKNRLGSLEVTKSARWRIDGCASQGRRFFALPIFMLPDLPLRRIDVFVPCQSLQAAPLRRSLQSSEAFNTSSTFVKHLAISRYIARALENWSANQAYFREIFLAMPFGSSIIIEAIVPDVREAKLRFVPNTAYKARLLAQETLQQMWQLPPTLWPSILEVNLIQHKAQLHDSVSVVAVPHLYGSREFIFKSSPRRPKYVYHELKLLLMMNPHPNVISKPLHLVAERDEKSGTMYILGFILNYHTSGTLKEALDSWCVQGKQCLILQYHWARQTIQTLQAIMAGPARFFSELKPDNLIVSQPGNDIVFIDFEQAGNWDTFSAPEILYVEQLTKLATSSLVPPKIRLRYKTLLQALAIESPASEEVYSNPPQGYYSAWVNLLPREQEAAMVYALGKLLWCIFEGCSHTKNSLEENYHVGVAVEFPAFRNTPPGIRQLIKSCTSGSPDWNAPDDIRIIRKGPKIFPLMQGSAMGGSACSPAEIMDAAKALWSKRVHELETYIEAKIRWVEGSASTEDKMLLGFPQRPRLTDVLATIVKEEVRQSDN